MFRYVETYKIYNIMGVSRMDNNTSIFDCWSNKEVG